MTEIRKPALIGGLLFVGILLVYAFNTSFYDGIRLLGEIINILGFVIVWLFKFVFSISTLAEEIIKRIITLILIWGICIWRSIDNYRDRNIVAIVAKGIVAISFTVISWIGVF